jgi:fumarate hydratase class II
MEAGSLSMPGKVNPTQAEALATIAKDAHAEGTSLKDAAVASGLVSTEDFDRWVLPYDMLQPTP